jgi:hypothetical protein
MVQSEEDIIRYYGEKIKLIENQIHEIDRHIAELDAFEHREQSRMLPNEYKVVLHHTIAKAKSDASIAKGKAVNVANNLKQRIHAFMQKPKHS